MNRKLAEECARVAWEAKQEWQRVNGYPAGIAWDQISVLTREMEIAGMNSALTHVGLHALGGFFVE